MASSDVQANLSAIFASSPPTPGTKSVKSQLLADVHCQLAECILYDDIHDTIVWTDILGKQFHKLPLSGDNVAVVSQDLPAMLGAFAFRQDEPGYLCAWQDHFQLYDLDNNKALGDTSLGEDVTPDKLPTRLNDGRCDRQGKRFICGGYFGGMKGQKMKVFSCEYNDSGQLCHSPIIDNVEVTNSLCFDPSGNVMYFADSPTQQIVAYDYNADTGSISGKRLVHTCPCGVPDGSICDAQGFIWNAVWRGGAGSAMVHRIDPCTGDIVFTVEIPDSTSQVSCCCLGGKDLDILFITTAAEGRDPAKEPHAGAIYAAKVGVKGMKESRFVGGPIIN